MAWEYEVTVLLPFPIRIFGQSNIDNKEYTELLLTISEAENLLSNLQVVVDEARSV